MNKVKFCQTLFLAAAVLILGLAPAIVPAQTSTGSQITGVVKDSSGAVIPGASVTITDVNTSVAKTVLSGGDGSYVVPNLPPDPYTLKVTKAGFKTYNQSGIVLQINTNPAINVSMAVGSVDTEVVVQAGAAMVETQNPNVSQVINPQQVVDLPLNGRQPTDLIALSGAAVTAVSTNTSSSIGSTAAIGTLDYPSAVAFSIAGSQIDSTNYYLDGGQHLDYRTNIGLPLPFPDALSEFSLNTSAMPADVGVHPGGSVNAVTRSGSNHFHGNVFEFVRNGVMDSTNRTYALAEGGSAKTGVRDTLVRNQFGGTIGGPIKKDKIFFFAGYQGTMSNSTVAAAPSTASTALPTAAMMAGDFTAVKSGNTNGCSVQTVNSTYASSPGSNMITNTAYLTSSSAVVMQNFMKYVPSNVFTDACGDYTYQAAPDYNYESQYVGRTDWQRTSKDSIFGSYFMANYANPAYMQAGNILSTSGVGLADRIQTASIGDNYVVSPRTINTARLTFNRSATERISNPGVPTICSLGATGVACPVINNIDIIVGVKPGFEGYDYENSYGVSDGLAYINGKHQFSVGATFIHVQMNGDGTFQENPETTFNGGITGSTFADEVTGNVDTVSQGEGQLSRDGQNQPSIYAQDTWKLLPRFQLTGGLRWDPFFAQHNKYAEVGDFTLAGFLAGTESQDYVNAPPGMTFPGDNGFHGMSDTNNYTKNFAPRLGFVWDLNGKGTETLRAGYGYFYDTSVLWNTMHVVLNPPWGETLTTTPLSAQAGAGVNSPYTGNGGNPFPFFNPAKNFIFPTNGTFIFENQTNKPTAVSEWDLAFQKQISTNLLFSATYLGNKTSHVWLGISQNYEQPYEPLVYGIGTSSTSCTLNWGTTTATFPICNEPSGFTENATAANGSTVSNANARRVLNQLRPQYGPQLQGGLTTASAWGDGAYNGLLVSLEKRMSHGFQVLGNYTWSHCMDDGETAQDITNIPMNPLAPKASSWGNCTYNKKSLANLSVVAQTPRYENAMVRAVATGWNGSGIFTASSGYFYSVTDNYDISLTGVGSDRPNIVSNPSVAGPVAANTTLAGCGPNAPAGGAYAAGSSAFAPTSVHTLAHWYNPCAFSYAPLGTFGNLVRNSLVGPATWNLNLAFWRSFSLPEKISIDIRAEAFNALNHTQLSNPSLTLATSGTNLAPNTNAGLISTSSPTYQPRVMQLAIKANF